MAADFKAKDEVFVESLKRLGVIEGKRKDGSYDVIVGTLRVRCDASDLKARAELSKTVLKTLRGIAKPVAGSAKNPPSGVVRVDLHGLRVEEAMRVVEQAVDRAIMDGHSRMEIVHGIGSGRIRHALHAYLSKLPVIETYKVDDLNAGVTWVYF